ncbi:MAG TPA: hypothetical protein VJW23_03035 [Propionibacteriaceae bacterium]|nr:hypothetical protein [Propionibacteriaceae bacterium]
MDAQQLELARRAVAALREALTGEDKSTRLRRFVADCGSAEARVTYELVVHLLGQCAEPADLENALVAMDRVLADRLADGLIEGVDWNGVDWGG